MKGKKNLNELLSVCQLKHKIIDNIYYNTVCHLTCRIMKKTIPAMDLLEMMLNGVKIALYSGPKVTFQAFRRLIIMCAQLANILP